MKIKIRKIILISIGILAVFYAGRTNEDTRYKKQDANKAQITNFNNQEEVKKTEKSAQNAAHNEADRQRNKEIGEAGEAGEIEENIGDSAGRGDALRSPSLENEKSDNQSQSQEQPASQNQTNQLNQINQSFLVVRVIDGDTIKLENGGKVRYIGVNTPESADPRKPVQCFGKEASVKNEELVLNKRVRLEKDVSETDKYGRLLRYVYVGDTFINLELVKQGYASAATFPPDVKFNSVFVEADPRSKIDAARGEKWFCSEEEAVKAGWRKAGNCL